MELISKDRTFFIVTGFFSELTIKTPFTLLWFSDDFRETSASQDFLGQVEEKFWVETDSLLHSSIPKNSETPSSGTNGTHFPDEHAPHTQNPHNLSAQTFCCKTVPLCSTPGSDLFVTFQTSSVYHKIMYLRKIGVRQLQFLVIFPALNISNNVAAIHYDARITTKRDATFQFFS